MHASDRYRGTVNSPEPTPLPVRLVSSSDTPPPLLVFDREGVRRVDRECIDDCAMPGAALMENASAALASVCARLLHASHAPRDARILAVCGPGNNGGDGFAALRRLRNAGLRVAAAILGEPRDETGDAATNLTTLRALRDPPVPVRPVGRRSDLDALLAETGAPSLIIDAAFGTGLDRPLAGVPLDAVRWINETRASRRCPVVAADIPSGLGCDTGRPLGGEADAVVADATVTFAGLKVGFLSHAARRFLGEVFVADIGAPVEVLRRHGRAPGPGQASVVA